MLDPYDHPPYLKTKLIGRVLTNCLAGAIFTHQNYRSDTAVLTFNVRGVGSSAGSIGLLGLSTTTNEKDFSVVEAWAISLCRPQTVKRVVSSRRLDEILRLMILGVLMGMRLGS